METCPKSPAGLEISGECNPLLTEQDDAVRELSPEIPIKEEKVEEFMQELYRELYNSAAPTDHTMSFLTGDGKSETCGASVSDSASTVMAGIEFAGPTGSGCWWGQMEKCGGYYCCNDYDRERGDDQKIRFGKGIMDGLDLIDEELEDQWLARVLSWRPVELDLWF